jgi:hypothetical protein
MGLSIEGKSFTKDDILNKDLIIKMLKYEDQLYFSNLGQQIMINHGNNITSNNGSKTIQRMTLNYFGFNSMDSDLDNYRTIFHNYYISPIEYDKDVLSSVYYMRENRLLYYKTKKINVNELIPDVSIFKLDGKTKTSLYAIIKENQYNKCIIASFSMS